MCIYLKYVVSREQVGCLPKYKTKTTSWVLAQNIKLKLHQSYHNTQYIIARAGEVSHEACKDELR